MDDNFRTRSDRVSPRVKVPSPRPSYFSASSSSNILKSTSVDFELAQDLMQQHRTRNGNDRKDADSKPFTCKDSTPVLTDIVMGRTCEPERVTAGVVQVLFKDFEASLSIAKRRSSSIFKKLIQSDQTDIPHETDLLLQGIQNCSADIVLVLLQHAEESSKAGALVTAIQTNDPVKVEYVMAAGASARPLCVEFQEVISRGHDMMIDVLVSSSTTKRPCQDCLDRALLTAVQQRRVQLTKILLDHRPDFGTSVATTLPIAVKTETAELVEMIVAKIVETERTSLEALETLAKAVFLALREVDRNTRVGAEAQQRIVQCCLTAGATGDHVNKAILLAVRKGQLNILQCFTQAQATLYNDQVIGSAVIEEAIKTEHPEILRTSLQIRCRPGRNQMKKAMSVALSLRNFQARITMACVLLESGLCEKVDVSEVLLSLIETLVNSASHPTNREAYEVSYGLVKLFLTQGAADVNFQGGRFLSLAAGQGLAEILKFLIQQRPDAEGIDKAIPYAMLLSNPSKRYEVVRLLLDAGAQGYSVGEALSQSAGWGRDHLNLTKMLLTRSSVDFDSGRPLASAVRSGSLEQVMFLFRQNMLSSAAVAAAWAQVRMVEDIEFQVRVYDMLLSTRKVDEGLLNSALVGAAALDRRGQPLRRTMLKHGASPESLNGAAMAEAAKYFHFDTLRDFSDVIAPSCEGVYTIAFEALVQNPQWLKPRGLQIVPFLLERGARGKAVDWAFCQAAEHHDLDAVELLAHSGFVASEAFGVAFLSATENPNKWPTPDDSGLCLIELLLRRGVEAEFVNEMLLNAVKFYSSNSNPGFSSITIETLLTVGEGHADVNFREGEPLKIAIRRGNVDILTHLLEIAACTGCGATRESMTQAFAEAITTEDLKNQEVVLKIIEVLLHAKDGNATPDVNAHLPNYNNWAPILACLSCHPDSPKLVECLAKGGCNMEPEVHVVLYDDEDVQAEPATALIWALCQVAEHQIAAETIITLIDSKVSFDRSSVGSRVTPLILAAKHGRGDIVDHLLKKTAKVSSRDVFNRSALFYAARAGDLKAINALIGAEARINEGSLQEAARNLNSQAVELLIKAGHKTDFPSNHPCHGGRDALQELAFRAQPNHAQAPELDDTIQALMPRKSKVKVLMDPANQNHKNALFLALDNPDQSCSLVCRALLDAIWEHIKDPGCIYRIVHSQTGVAWFYSPTIYVKHGLFMGPPEQRHLLLRLLHEKKCPDRYYAEFGAEQPDDAMGMPDDIENEAAKVKARRAKNARDERDHQLSMIWREEKEREERLLIEIAHDEKLLHSHQMAEQKRHEADLANLQKMMHAASQHQQTLQLKAQTATFQQRIAMQNAQFEEQRQQRMAAFSQQKLRREQELKANYEHRITEEKLQRQQNQNLLAQQAAQQAAQQRLWDQKREQEVQAQKDKQKQKFKKKQDEQARKTLRFQTSNKREVHHMNMDKIHADQKTLKMKATTKMINRRR